MATKISFSLGYTVNTGDYESVRVNLGVEDDKRDKESMDDAYDRIAGWVQGKIEAEVAAIREDIALRDKGK